MRETDFLPGWVEYGDPSGIPLLYHHGMPGAHPEAALLDLEARIHGFRIIVPDRPGIGLTPYRALRSVSDLVAPCCALLDELKIATCHQVGWSSGGPVALAMAAQAPDRVSGVTLMASYTHFWEVAEVESLQAQAPRPAAILEGNLPETLNWLVGVMHWTERLLPWVYLRSLGGLCVEVDQELLAQGQVRKLFMAAQKMTFCQGMAGPRQDLALQFRDWGFRLADIDVPVVLFQGEEDPFVVPANGDDLAGRLSRCELRKLDAEGHLFPLDREFQNQWLRDLRQRLAWTPPRITPAVDS